MKKKHPLTQKARRMMILFSVIIILLTCIGVSISYYYQAKSSYKAFGFGYTRTVAEMLDGDKIENYLTTKTKDDYYNAVEKKLKNIQSDNRAGADEKRDEAMIDYFYVVAKTDNGMMYIWNTNESEDYQFGDVKEFAEADKYVFEKEFKENPEEELMFSRTATQEYYVSAHSPIFNTDGKVVALVGAQMQVQGVSKLVTQYIPMVVAILLVIIAAGAAVMFMSLRKLIIKPISRLNEAAKQMVSFIARGERHPVEIHSEDEIEELADSFNTMSDEMIAYIEQLAAASEEKQKMIAELNVANTIQTGALPQVIEAFRENPAFSIDASMTPARDVGGDFYDFYMLGDSTLAFLIADVSGKGIPAAMFMMQAKTIIKDLAESGLELSEIFTTANKKLCENNDAGMFVTAWMGFLNLETGELKYANAGHNKPLIRRKDGLFEYLEGPAGFVLAGMEGIVYKEQSTMLEPGDEIFLYTDGVVEATNVNKQLYGDDRLQICANRNIGADSMTLCNIVKEDVDKFYEGADQFDDITELSMQFKKYTTKNKSKAIWIVLWTK